jgi:acetyl-CoA carboxylase carboxyltransferase component
LDELTSPVPGLVVAVLARIGDVVDGGAAIVAIESMKMEHPVAAPRHGRVREILVKVGDSVGVGQAVAEFEPIDTSPDANQPAGLEGVVDPAHVRPDLAELLERRLLLQDEARPEATDRRHGTGKRTARENLEDLVDEGSFVEYGGFAVAAQASRRSEDDLRRNTPADGMIAGIGRVNGDLFPGDGRPTAGAPAGDLTGAGRSVAAAGARTETAIVSYDYTVLAGTQGQRNHQKKDRLFELIERLRLPVVLFAEGGGGRPGDTDFPVISGLDTEAFHLFGRLSGLVPLVGVVEGRCFAGNAALLGCCDVIIATRDANIGMGGPAMIEGGGLGVFSPDEVGPVDVQWPNGVIDILAEDDVEAVSLAKKYLSYFQGQLSGWEIQDQQRLRHLVPEHRSTVYDVREVIATLADIGSVLELRAGFGHGIVTCLARIEGRPVGIFANNNKYLGGAIDAPGADKAARFLQLCDAFDLPVLSLCDTPGFMVGPEAETTAQVRHFSRMFVVGASLTVPFMTVVLRKGYGLGAQAMAGGSFRAPLFTVSWPTGEFGGMGLEGAIRLSMRKELAAIEDEAERERVFERLVAHAYKRGKALSMATNLEIDDVIDPAETRRRVVAVLGACPPPPPRHTKKRPCIDTW